jgi:hypothetical protein
LKSAGLQHSITDRCIHCCEQGDALIDRATVGEVQESNPQSDPFSTADVPRSADREQLAALESYKKDRQKDTLYFDFGDTDTLRDHLVRHLPNIIQEVLKTLGLANSAPSPLKDPPTRDEPGQDSVKASDWERMAEKLQQFCRFLRADSPVDQYYSSRVWRIAGRERRNVRSSAASGWGDVVEIAKGPSRIFPGGFG